MISKDKHQKHPPINRPKSGRFARNEWAIIGAPCSKIENLAKKISALIRHSHNAIYIDADHGQGEDHTDFSVFMDMISHHSTRFDRRLNDYEIRLQLKNYDLALVNGNHFEADRQLVIISESKKDSLRKKLNRLTQVDAIILDEGVDLPFDFVIEHIGDPAVPIFSINDISAITSLILKGSVPTPLYGLVLAGGRSSRMGTDKSAIEYHGMPQQDYMASQLEGLCDKVYISKRAELGLPSKYPVIADSFTGLGPYGAILSAFKSYPDAAWLVTACDQPLLHRSHLKILIDQRQTNKIATCFYNPDTQFPEPLITLWEPKAYTILLQYLAMGYACPRKVLINSDINMIHTEDHTFMYNVNTPEERDKLFPV